MPIPTLQENGFLPPGLYLADLEEIWERFGRTSERRQMLFSRLRTFVELAIHVEALRMFVDGSYLNLCTLESGRRRCEERSNQKVERKATKGHSKLKAEGFEGTKSKASGYGW